MTNDRMFWTNVARARVSRRRVLAGASVLGAMAYATPLAGCGEQKGTSVRTEVPRSGGTLRAGGTLALASGLDPHIESGAGLAIFPRMYGYLLHGDSRDESVIYDHAESHEQPDDLTYVFTLREGLRFHDVAPVNARDVVGSDVARSFERYRDHRLVPTKTWHATVLDRVEAPDARTVRITTRIPYAYSLGEIGGMSGGVILPSEVIDQNIDLTGAAIGSGPFRLDSAAPDDVSIVRNDAYYMTLPYVDAMQWRVYASDAEKRAAFEDGQADVVGNRDKTEAEEFSPTGADVETDRAPSLASVALGLRVVPGHLFSDTRVRQAMDLALDRGALIDELAAGDGEILGPVNPHLADGYWSLNQDEIEANSSTAAADDDGLTEARQLVAAAGVENASFTLQVPRLPQLIDVATLVREQLLQLGFSIVLRELEQLEWYGTFRTGNFDATLISHLPYESADIPMRFYHSRGPYGDASPFGFGDAEIDRLVERSWGEFDREERRATVLEAQQLALPARPMLPLFTSAGYSSARSYVRDRGATLPGALAQYHYTQWLAQPVESD